MTSVEPGLVDANVFVYAFNTGAPQHLASRNLLEAARTGATTLFVTSQVLCEFYAIVTNALRVLKPRSSSPQCDSSPSGTINGRPESSHRIAALPSIL